MRVLKISLHKVDHFKNLVEERLDDSIPSDYIIDIVNKVESKKGVRRHIFKSDTVEAKNILDKYLLGEFDKYKNRFPERLLELETRKQIQIKKLGKIIKAGVLFQAIVETDNLTKILIVKADNLGFFDDVDFKLRNGLPKDKKIFKAMLFEYNKEEEDSEIYIQVDNSAKYWWDEFLDLKELQTDEINTELAFKAIEKSVLSSLKRKEAYHPDFIFTKNIIVSYFTTKKEFKIDEISKLIRNYAPLHQDLSIKMKTFADKILALPLSKNFDATFQIKPNVIPRKSITEEIELRPNLSLLIKGELPDLDKIIKPDIFNGEKGIQIISNQAYMKFGGK